MRACSLLFVVMALAQVRDTASLFGTVSDPQGAVVASAKVSITNPSTGFSRSAVTDASGGFVFTLASGRRVQPHRRAAGIPQI